MRLIDFRMGIYVLMAALFTDVGLAKPEQVPNTDTKKEAKPEQAPNKKKASGKSTKIPSGVTKIPSGVLGRLSSEQYGERVKAYTELEKWASANVETSPEVLHGAWRLSDDPEAKTRCFALMKRMAVQRQWAKGKGFVGIRMEEFLLPGLPGKPARPSVKVSFILPGTPAAKSGLREGDVIWGVDDLDFSKGGKVAKKERVFNERAGMLLGMETVSRCSQYIQSKQPGDEITLHLFREGKKKDIKIKLMKRPASADRADRDPFGRRDHRKREEREADRFFKQWLEEKGN